MSCDVSDLSSLIRDRTCAPGIGSAVSTTGLPGKSMFFCFLQRTKAPSLTPKPDTMLECLSQHARVPSASLLSPVFTLKASWSAGDWGFKFWEGILSRPMLLLLSLPPPPPHSHGTRRVAGIATLHVLHLAGVHV